MSGCRGLVPEIVLGLEPTGFVIRNLDGTAKTDNETK
jgi:hypothetical protein